MKKIIYSAIALTLVSASFLFPQSARTPATAAEMVAHQVAHLTTLLTLTTQQQTEVTTYLTQEQTATSGLFANLKTARTALETAVEANDAGGITTASTQIGSLIAQQTQYRATAQAEIYAILSPDQQTKYKQLLSGGPGGLGGFGPGPGGPGGPGGHGGPGPDGPQ